MLARRSGLVEQDGVNSHDVGLVAGRPRLAVEPQRHQQVLLVDVKAPDGSRTVVAIENAVRNTDARTIHESKLPHDLTEPGVVRAPQGVAAVRWYAGEVGTKLLTHAQEPAPAFTGELLAPQGEPLP